MDFKLMTLIYIKINTEVIQPNYSKIITIDDNIDTDTYVADNKGGKLFIVTNYNAPNQRLVKIGRASCRERV